MLPQPNLATPYNCLTPQPSRHLRLYLMNGLTTRFGRPVPPEPGLVTRDSLGIPPPPGLGRDSDRLSVESSTTASTVSTGSRSNGVSGSTDAGVSCGSLYIVPQTLYKIHPDFDRLVAGVLKADRLGCVVFIRAVEAAATEALTRRMSKVLLAAGVEPERVIFIRRWVLFVFFSVVGRVKTTHAVSVQHMGGWT